MRRYGLISAIIIIMAAVLFIQIGCMKTPTPEEIKASFELVDLETKWVSKYYQPWPPKLIIVPSVSFRVKNVTEKPLRYLYFNAIFRSSDEAENMGDGFLAAIRGKPIVPGGLSEPILLKSNFGVEGQNLAHFKNNPYWKTALVRLFVKYKGSDYVFIKEWTVSKKIDFKEPEPVGIEKKKKTEKK